MTTILQRDANRMISARLVDEARPLADMQQLLAAIAEHDLNIEERIRKNNKRAIILALSSFVFLFAGLFLMDVFPYIFLGIPICFFLLFILLIHIWRLKRRDLANDFRLFVTPVLARLSTDIKKNSLVSLYLPLDSANQKKHLVTKSKPYQSGVYHKCIDSTFERDFLRLDLRLADGNRLHVDGRETLVESRKTKRNRRNKYKTKFKFKRVLTLSLRLTLDGEQFTQGQEIALPEEGAKFCAKEGSRGQVLSLRYSQKLGSKDDVPDTHLFLKHLVRLYARLQPAAQAA